MPKFSEHDDILEAAKLAASKKPGSKPAPKAEEIVDEDVEEEQVDEAGVKNWRAKGKTRSQLTKSRRKRKLSKMRRRRRTPAQRMALRKAVKRSHTPQAIRRRQKSRHMTLLKAGESVNKHSIDWIRAVNDMVVETGDVPFGTYLLGLDPNVTSTDLGHVALALASDIEESNLSDKFIDMDLISGRIHLYFDGEQDIAESITNFLAEYGNAELIAKPGESVGNGEVSDIYIAALDPVAEATEALESAMYSKTELAAMASGDLNYLVDEHDAFEKVYGKVAEGEQNSMDVEDEPEVADGDAENRDGETGDEGTGDDEDDMDFDAADDGEQDFGKAHPKDKKKAE